MLLFTQDTQQIPSQAGNVHIKPLYCAQREINTLRGNINWMTAREQRFVSEAFGEDLKKLLPIIDNSGSDSSMLDNAFEFFVLAGRTPAHTAMMLIPEPWTENPHISEEKKHFMLTMQV